MSFLLCRRVDCPHARQREIQTARQFSQTLKALSSRFQGRVGLHGVFPHRQGTCSAPFGEGAVRQAPPDHAVDGATTTTRYAATTTTTTGTTATAGPNRRPLFSQQRSDFSTAPGSLSLQRPRPVQKTLSITAATTTTVNTKFAGTASSSHGGTSRTRAS